MDLYNQVLKVYSIVVCTLLVIISPLIFPKLQGLFILLLFLPVTVYFWLRLTSPKDVGTGEWSVRLVAIIALLCLLFLLAFRLISQKSADKTSQEVITPELIQTPIASISGQINEIPPDDLQEIKDQLVEIKAMLSTKGFTLGIDDESLSSPSSVLNEDSPDNQE